MIKGLGIDVEDINRFRAMPFQSNRRFYEKIFTQEEMDYCLGKDDPYQHFAARFCAKEAFIKAFPFSEIKLIPPYKQFMVTMEHKKPLIQYKQHRYFLSLSHDHDKAIAVVIVS